MPKNAIRMPAEQRRDQPEQLVDLLGLLGPELGLVLQVDVREVLRRLSTAARAAFGVDPGAILARTTKSSCSVKFVSKVSSEIR